MNKQEVLHFLDNHEIDYEIVEHCAVYTMEDMYRLNLPHSSQICVNLFLRDDKKRKYYLCCISQHNSFSLKQLAQIMGSRPLSFASESDLNNILGVQKGSVTPLAILNDIQGKTEVWIDSWYENQLIGVHPNENTATVFIECQNLKNLLINEGHTVKSLTL